MTPAQIQLAFAAIDGLLTGIDFITEKVKEAKKSGAILTPEQEERLAKVEAERTAIGFPGK